MKYVDEYRRNKNFLSLVDGIRRISSRKHVIMEVCGGQTHSIVKYGIDCLLSDVVEFVHGPGCPVCVAPVSAIDNAILLASRPEFIFATFGDMMRVPGSSTDLLSARASGADVRMVYSPLDAVSIAVSNPLKQVVFFAIGFETTAPANAAALLWAKSLNLQNFSLLTSMVTVPAAVKAVVSDSSSSVEALLAAGHVCSVMGYWQYVPLAEEYRMPIVVTGFEPIDILYGIHASVRQLEQKTFRVENCYSRAVEINGNIQAIKLISDVFKLSDQYWRGLGLLPMSGLSLKDEFRDFDASDKFQLSDIQSVNDNCLGGDIMKGKLKPFDCPLFGKACTPDHPIGAQMVSSEGFCSSYMKYNINKDLKYDTLSKI